MYREMSVEKWWLIQKSILFIVKFLGEFNPKMLFFLAMWDWSMFVGINATIGSNNGLKVAKYVASQDYEVYSNELQVNEEMVIFIQKREIIVCIEQWASWRKECIMEKLPLTITNLHLLPKFPTFS